ncbi:hypothetical protein [Lachnobacterium bovis]|uniref:hypothetical protein n=1 Tax=Lachnobacterium bovis TaxID=140626 RepID=UPI0004845531|nr:hypothetical protein [Lachnobacterium bovis]
MNKKSLVVLFPGVGYTCDKPLLYYTGKLFVQDGYEIKKLSYCGFQKNIKDDKEKMNHAYELVKNQTLEQLKDVNWDEYEKVIFISKSIGTVGASSFFKYLSDKKIIKKDLKISNIFLTPLEETFKYVIEKSGVVVIGDKDQWSDYTKIIELSKKYKLSSYVIENANHSLENSDIINNLEIIAKVVKIVDSSR